MAVEFYVEQADRSPLSALANEDVYAGELLFDDSADGADVLTFANAVNAAHIGLARYDAEAMAAETEEDVVEEKYVAGERIQYQPTEEDAARVRIRTPENNGTDPAPTIGHQDIVGVVDASALQGTAAEFQGRIVPEGYSDGTTTFDRGSGNFKAIGVAYRPGIQTGDNVNQYDYPVRVRLFGEVEA